MFRVQADKDGDESIDRNEFVSFLKQFPKAFSILEYVFEPSILSVPGGLPFIVAMHAIYVGNLRCRN